MVKPFKGELNCQKTWIPPKDMDFECVGLCGAMNSLPGIETTESCGGHGKDPYRIWFKVTDYNEIGLTAMSRFLCDRYFKFGSAYGEITDKAIKKSDRWKILVEHADAEPLVQFLLEGPRGDYSGAAALAQVINDHVNGSTDYYNIVRAYKNKETA